MNPMDEKNSVEELDAGGLQRLIQYAKKKRKMLLANSEMSTSTNEVNLERDEDDPKRN